MLFFPQCIVKRATAIVHMRMDVNWYTYLQMDADVIVFVVHLLLQDSDLLNFWINVIMKIDPIHETTMGWLFFKTI